MAKKITDIEPMLEENSDEILLGKTTNEEILLEESEESEVLLEKSSDEVLLEESADSETLLEEMGEKERQAEEEAKRKEEEARILAKRQEEVRTRERRNAAEERRRQETERKAKEETSRKAKEAEDARSKAVEEERKAAEEARRKAEKAESKRLEAERRAEEEAIRIVMEVGENIEKKERTRAKMNYVWLIIGLHIAGFLLMAVCEYIYEDIYKGSEFSWKGAFPVFLLLAVIFNYLIFSDARKEGDVFKSILHFSLGTLWLLIGGVFIWMNIKSALPPNEEELKTRYDSVYNVEKDGLRIIEKMERKDWSTNEDTRYSHHNMMRYLNLWKKKY